MLMLLVSLWGIYSLYQYFIYGNPQKIKESEEIVLDYLINEKGYGNQDIMIIKGIYNWKESSDSKYGGTLILKEQPQRSYDFGIKNEKVIEFEDIPKKSD